MVRERDAPEQGKGDEECRAEENAFARVQPREHRGRVDDVGRQAGQGSEEVEDVARLDGQREVDVVDG